MTRNIAVVGSGYMGGGIAQVLALAGARVALTDVSAEVADKNFHRLIAESKDFVRDGLFPEGATETLEANLWAADSLEQAVGQAEFIEEAVPEVLAIKHDILAQISAAAPAEAIIGSNTSTISIGDMASAVEHPERFLGVHFSNPSPFIPGVEIIPHAGTDPDVVSRARELVHEAGKLTAVVKDVTGFVLNRLQYALFHEATQLGGGRYGDCRGHRHVGAHHLWLPVAVLRAVRHRRHGRPGCVRLLLPVAADRVPPNASPRRRSCPIWFRRGSSAPRPAPAS